jgi:hypothetical protein
VIRRLSIAGLNTSVGTEVYWINEKNDWSAAAGVRYRSPQQNKQESVTVSCAMNKFGFITAAWSIPVKSDLTIAARMNYDVPTYISSLQLGAQWRPVLPVLKKYQFNASMDPNRYGYMSLQYSHSDDISFEGTISRAWDTPSGGTKLGLGLLFGV